MRRRWMGCAITVALVWGCGGEPDPSPADGGGDPMVDAGTEPMSDAGSDPVDDGGVEPPTDAGGSGDAGGGHLAAEMVGPSGGTVATGTGVSIEIPEGALSSDQMITIDEVADVTAPDGAVAVGTTYELGPEGLTFDVPVRVTLPHDGTSMAVVVAHSPRGGADWTALTGGSSDATTVTASTSSFSWFRPVYYQGAPDAPIVLDSDRPVNPVAVPLAESTTVRLRGTGFRTDTVVTLFKDGVTTATVSDVTLTRWGLSFDLPTAFTSEVGLITVQAMNPAATVGDAIAVYAIARPVLNSLSPTSLSVVAGTTTAWVFTGGSTVTVAATDLPSELSLCTVSMFLPVGGDLALPAEVSVPTREATGFSFSVERVQMPGPHNVALYCGAASSNVLVLNIVDETPSG